MKLSEAKKQARKAILEIANCYEPIRRKVLKGVTFQIDTDGDLVAMYIGKAHDYHINVKLS
jgi:hypothetical protein